MISYNAEDSALLGDKKHHQEIIDRLEKIMLDVRDRLATEGKTTGNLNAAACDMIMMALISTWLRKAASGPDAAEMLASYMDMTASLRMHSTHCAKFITDKMAQSPEVTLAVLKLVTERTPGTIELLPKSLQDICEMIRKRQQGEK